MIKRIVEVLVALSRQAHNGTNKFMSDENINKAKTNLPIVNSKVSRAADLFEQFGYSDVSSPLRNVQLVLSLIQIIF